MEKWVVPLSLMAFAAMFIVFGVAFLRKSRARRREMFAEPGYDAGAALPEAGDDEQSAEDDSGRTVVDDAPQPEAATADAAAARRGPDMSAPEAATTAPGQGDATDTELATEAGAEAAVEPDAAEAVPGSDEAHDAAKPAPVVDEALRVGLKRTHDGFLGRLAGIFGRSSVDTDILDELEEVLLTSDVGVKLSMSMLDELRDEIKTDRLKTGADVRQGLRDRVRSALNGSGVQPGDDSLAYTGAKPRVILFVGVNGVGKTTSIGKVAQKLVERDQKVVLAAGDTFRAAATEQLAIWGERTGCNIIRGDEGADPAAVVFNAVQHGCETGVDVVLADTAGRLHTKTELMDEIRKVKRAAGKACDGAPHEVWLVVDATTGQNAVQQANEFNKVLGLTGVILTKLDGTAKGGVVVAIADALKLPVRFIGVGEKAEDLRQFDADAFVDALFAGD